MLAEVIIVGFLISTIVITTGAFIVISYRLLKDIHIVVFQEKH